MSEYLFEDKNDDFDIFWENYPWKAGKGTALRAWKHIKPSNQLKDIILVALSFHKKQESWNQDGGKWIPRASTWLNQRRWEDQVKLPHEQKVLSDAEKIKNAEKMADRAAELYRLAEKDLAMRRAGLI